MNKLTTNVCMRYLQSPEEYPPSLHQEPIYCSPAQNRLTARQATTNIQTLHYFINLPSVWVYRSPQRNKYCRGPILAYWPRMLPAQEFLFKRKEKKGREPWSVNLSCLYLSDFVTFCCLESLNQALQLIQSLNEFIHGSILSSTPKAHQRASGLADTLANFCSLSVANLTDAPRLSTSRRSNPPSPVRPHSEDTSAGLTAGTRVHPCAGQAERWKVERGSSQRWEAARRSNAQQRSPSSSACCPRRN